MGTYFKYIVLLGISLSGITMQASFTSRLSQSIRQYTGPVNVPVQPEFENDIEMQLEAAPGPESLKKLISVVVAEATENTLKCLVGYAAIWCASSDQMVGEERFWKTTACYTGAAATITLLHAALKIKNAKADHIA